MSLERTLALATRIIRQILRDKRTLGLIFIVPLLIMTLLYLVLTNTSSVHTLAIVRPTDPGSDTINTLITDLLPGKDKLNTIYIPANQVTTTLQNGNADAAILFPPDFARQVLAGQNPVVQIELEGSDPTVASAMRDLTESFTHQLGLALSSLKAQQNQGGQVPITPATLAGPTFHHQRATLPAWRAAIYVQRLHRTRLHRRLLFFLRLH